MAKIKWKLQKDIDAEKVKNEKRQKQKAKFKNKKFTTLSSKQKDELLEQMAKDLGYL